MNRSGWKTGVGPLALVDLAGLVFDAFDVQALELSSVRALTAIGSGPHAGSFAATDPWNGEIVIFSLHKLDPDACDLAQPSVDLLWPPNHRLEPVAIEGTDFEGGASPTPSPVSLRTSR